MIIPNITTTTAITTTTEPTIGAATKDLTAALANLGRASYAATKPAVKASRNHTASFLKRLATIIEG